VTGWLNSSKTHPGMAIGQPAGLSSRNGGAHDDPILGVEVVGVGGGRHDRLNVI
jgi:hypothetical protein